MTDDTALTERIARAMYAHGAPALEVGWDRYSADGLGNWRDPYRHAAAAVLPVIHAEVKRAQAQAWDEGNHAGTRDQANWDGWRYPRGYQEHVNPYRTEQNHG